MVIFSGELTPGTLSASELLGDQKRKIANATAPATIITSTIINPLVNSMERSALSVEIIAPPALKVSSIYLPT
jgi:hypothetical protein